MPSKLLQRLLPFLLFFACAVLSFAQTESASLTGNVKDTTGAVIVDAEVHLQSVERGTSVTTRTNTEGIYVFPSVHPGQYRLMVSKQGFQRVDILGIVASVQDHLQQNVQMSVGSADQSVTITAESPLINTQDASVSTIVDRNFAENLPLNGRGFQTLIYLTPGAISTSAGGYDSGQFSVNGQRPSSNYWTLDGVSANSGVNPLGLNGNQIAGGVGATSVMGGTNGLVSVDAVQEFRIQTSTFAPEYGRTPGAQISIATRSGTNGFHGSAFDYLRNDKLDANNWFNGYQNSPPLPKAQERQNDFGGTLSGPVLKNRTFFFFSYEGLRLRLPNTILSVVPDAATRQNAIPAMQPILNAFPLDPAQPDLGNGQAQFNASFSDPASLDDYSIRVDHKITENLLLFVRYNNSPSEISQRAGGGIEALSTVLKSKTSAQQLTLGATYQFTSRLIDEFRFNYSHTSGESGFVLDNFGGAVPFTTLPLPTPFDKANGAFAALFEGVKLSVLAVGPGFDTVQQQYNVIDNVSFQKGSHTIKFGFDYRRLSPTFSQPQYNQLVFFLSMASAEQGQLFLSRVSSFAPGTLLFRNISAFTQDTWRVAPKLTASYGLRWDTDLPPETVSGPKFPSLTGFSSLSDLSGITFAPTGTPAFRTSYRNFAPRVGLAYQLSQQKDFETVLRGGFGVFYDLATSETGNIVFAAGYPFSAQTPFSRGGTFPLSTPPPPIVPPSTTSTGSVAGYVANFKSPYTLQWNFAIQQGLGSQQSITATYVGAEGRRLAQSSALSSPTPNIVNLVLVANTATSDYHALQMQLHRRMARDLQLLASYTWSHSIDTGSAGSVGVSGNRPSISGNSQLERGDSDFDVRHAFSAGLTYSVPAWHNLSVIRHITEGWSLQSIVQAQSARPVPIFDARLSLANGSLTDIRPDVVPGVPLYLHGSQYPGGKAINNTVAIGACPDGSNQVGPFCPPPNDGQGTASRQGNLGRNSIRGFGLFQWDFGVHREFPITEALKLQFRAEMFNVLNHPNFGPPAGDISSPSTFGLSNQMLGQYLAGTNVGGGSLSSLYQTGGPRSIQLALKVLF